MLVVLASRHDQAVDALVADWPAEVSVLTCQDLSVEGWWHCPGSEVGAAVVGGARARAESIDGVLTRLPYVDESELGDIVPSERAYVAAEMTAFLSAWLSGLRCPVLNPAAAASLMGPCWRRERWVRTAAKLGIPVVAAHRSAPLVDAIGQLTAPITVTVVGQRCLGDVDEPLQQSAIRLAASAGVSLLRAEFTGSDGDAAFLGADYWVDIADPEVSEAILKYFAEQGHS